MAVLDNSTITSAKTKSYNDAKSALIAQYGQSWWDSTDPAKRESMVAAESKRVADAGLANAAANKKRYEDSLNKGSPTSGQIWGQRIGAASAAVLGATGTAAYAAGNYLDPARKRTTVDRIKPEKQATTTNQMTVGGGADNNPATYDSAVPEDQSWYQTAIDSVSGATDASAQALQMGMDNYANLTASADKYVSDTQQFITDLAASTSAFNNNLNSYINTSTQDIGAQKSAYDAAQKGIEKQNAEITKMLEADRQRVLDLKPDEKQYADFRDRMSVLEQELANNPYAKDLEDMYLGKKPSAAELLLKKAQEEALAQQLSMTSSARGGVNYSALARTASNNIVVQNQKAAQDAAILRAQEQERMIGMLLQNQQATKAQQMQMLNMRMANDAQQQNANLQWSGAVSAVTGQNADWQNNVANQQNARASMGLNFTNALNSLQSLGVQGQQINQGAAGLTLNAQANAFGAAQNVFGAGMDLSNMLSNNAMQVAGLGMNLSGMIMDDKRYTAGSAADAAMFAWQQKEAERQRALQERLGLLSAGSTLLASVIP